MAIRKFTAEIQDTVDALGLSPTQISKLLQDTNNSKAISDQFASIDGGLASLVTILLRQANSRRVTAGLSGIQTDKNGILPQDYMPAKWSGGTYQEAINFGIVYNAFEKKLPIPVLPMANIVELHNGVTRNGDLIIDRQGALYTINMETGEIKFKVNAKSLPRLQDLLSNNYIGGSGSNVAVTGITTTYELPNKLNVTENGSEATFNLDMTLFAMGGITAGSVAVSQLTLHKNGAPYKLLSSVFMYNMGDYEERQESVAYTDTVYNLDKGLYSVVATIDTLNDPTYARVNIAPSAMSWQFNRQNVKHGSIGLDGFMFWYTNTHLYYSEQDGLSYKGKMDMPGALGSGSFGSSGVQDASKRWGAKSSSDNAYKVSTGRYRIYHGVGHENFNAIISPHAWYYQSMWRGMNHGIVNKTSTYVEVVFTDFGGNPQDVGFDVTFYGNNF